MPTPDLLSDQQPQPQKPKNNSNKRKRPQIPDPPSIEEYWNPDSSSSSSSHHLQLDITIADPSPSLSPSSSSSSPPPCTVAELPSSSSSSPPLPQQAAVVFSERSGSSCEEAEAEARRGDAAELGGEEDEERREDVGCRFEREREAGEVGRVGYWVVGEGSRAGGRDTWEDVDKGVKEQLKDDLKKFFVLDYTNPTVLGYVDESMKQAYRDFKSLLKKEYNCAGDHDEEISKINSENRKSNGVAKGSKNDGPSRQSIISVHENKICSLESVIEALRAEVEALKAKGEALKS